MDTKYAHNALSFTLLLHALRRTPILLPMRLLLLVVLLVRLILSDSDCIKSSQVNGDFIRFDYDKVDPALLHNGLGAFLKCVQTCKVRSSRESKVSSLSEIGPMLRDQFQYRQFYVHSQV